MRDQVESPVIVSVTPQTDFGKRARGKERIRRKGSGKRKRENDFMEGQIASEDESQFGGAVVEVHQILRRADGEADHLQLSHAVGGSDDAHLGLADAIDKVDDTEFCDAANEVDESQLYATEVNGSHLCDATYEAHDSQLSHVAAVSDLRSVKDSAELVTQASQLHDATNEVNDSKVCNATDEVKDSKMSDTADEVKDVQIPDSTDAVNDTQTCDQPAHVNDVELYDTTIEVSFPQPEHVAGENDAHTAKGEEEVIPQSSLETVEDIAKQGDNGIVA